jgi:O-antigen/teichoic acid export membrane protein
MPDIKSLSVGAKLKEAGRHSVIYGLGSVAQSAVGFLLLPILTGSLSKNDFGVYSLILMASTVASSIFYMGMSSALPRSYFDYESDEQRRAVFTTAFIILSFGALIQILLGYYFGDLISKLLVGEKNQAVAVAWAFFGSSVAFVNQYFFSFLRILRKSIASVTFSLISLIGGVGFTLLFLKHSPGSLNAPFEAIAYSQIIITAIFLGRYGKVAFIIRFERREVSNLVLFGVASIIASFGNMLLDWADRIIIERFLTLADVGVYSAAFRVGTLINVIMIFPFSQIWYPMMMEYRSNSNIGELFTQIFSYFMILGSVILLASSLFAGELLPLLIRSGVSSSVISVFLLVMLGSLAYGTTNIVAAGIFYERKVFRLTYIYYSVAGLKIGVNILIIPIFGIIGAAVSTLVAYILVPVGIYALARKYFSFRIDWKRLGILGMNCVPPLMYGIYLSEKYQIDWPVRLVWFLLSLVVIYLTCFSKTERIEMKNLIHAWVYD